MSSDASGPTVIRHSAGLHVFLWTAFPLAGGALGALVSRLPGWVADLPWAPNQDQITELADVIGLKVTIALVVVGLLAGGVLALLAYDDIVEVRVGREAVTVTRGDDTSTHPGVQVTGAFVDGKALVLLGLRGEELAREKTDHAVDRLRPAFEEHGYRWHPTDPHDGEFRRWVDGMPGLGTHAQAVLRARHTALEADDGPDARELRAELAGLGVVVRDENKRQYWRGVDDD